MQNPFTTTFSKTPDTYITTEQPNEILENFSYDRPSESVYKITGVRGSGKTVILAKVEDELRKNGWLVFDINPARDTLQQIAAMLSKEGFSKKKDKNTGFNVSATVMGTGGGFGYSTSDSGDKFFDIGIEVEGMIQEAQKKQKKILIGIDEISKTDEMVKFASEYGRWLRADYPVYLVCTGLYENIQELSNVKNLTFFRRATTIQTEPLNKILMAEMYKNKLNISTIKAKEMAFITKGYAYAFQEFGVLSFKKGINFEIDDVVPELKTELFAYSYEKIWEEMTDMDKLLARLLVDKAEYKREEVLILMKDKAPNYSMYRDRLIKRGVIVARQGYISLALPFFADYIKEYCE